MVPVKTLTLKYVSANNLTTLYNNYTINYKEIHEDLLSRTSLVQRLLTNDQFVSFNYLMCKL